MVVVKSSAIISPTWFELEVHARGFAISVSLKPWRRTNELEHFLAVTLWRYPFSGRMVRSSRHLRLGRWSG
jgi:hypothetical protein